MVKDKVISIIAKQLNANAAEITLDTKIKSLGADSLDMTDIIFALEDEFSIQVDDNDNIGNIKTISDVIDYVGQKLK